MCCFWIFINIKKFYWSFVRGECQFSRYSQAFRSHTISKVHVLVVASFIGKSFSWKTPNGNKLEAFEVQRAFKSLLKDNEVHPFLAMKLLMSHVKKFS